MSPIADVDAEITSLRRLVHAEKCFRRIMRLAKFLANANLSEGEEAFTPVMTGICFTYAQPFWSNDGLGPLPQHFHQFPNHPEHQELHEGLLSGREWISDHLAPDTVFMSDASRERFGKMQVTLLAGGSVILSEDDPLWHQHELRRIGELCRFQMARIAPEARALVAGMSAGKTYALGSYVIGENFP